MKINEIRLASVWCAWVANISRLSLSACSFRRSRWFHRLRSEILHRSIKKSSKLFWKRKKLEQKQNFKILVVLFFWKFWWIFWWKTDENFSFFSKKNGGGHQKKSFFLEKKRPKFLKFCFCSNFFRFQNNLMIYLNISM